jgi:hypothetical protein
VAIEARQPAELVTVDLFDRDLGTGGRGAKSLQLR